MHLYHIQKCRLCGNPHLEEIINLTPSYSQGFFIYKDKPPPSMRKIPNRIVRCNTQKWENACGLVQNAVIVPPEVLYSNYSYSSSISNTMTAHLKDLYDKIIDIKGNLDGRFVCDVGSNDGTFLSFFGSKVKKIGIDPSDVARTVAGDIKVINECFPTDKLAIYLRNAVGDFWAHKIDVFTAWACLYDMSDIIAVFEEVKDHLTQNGIFAFEVAYLPTVLSRLNYDGMCNEHISLFSLATLEWALNKVGLKIFLVEKTSTNSGSLLVFTCNTNCMEFDIEENRNRLKELRLEEFSAELDEPKTYEFFRKRVTQHGIELRELLINLKNQGKRIHILGASTKLNTILYTWNIGPELIDCASERDPRKWGGKILNGIPIVSEDESRKNVDVYLVGPCHFFREILIREKDLIMNRGVSLIFSLPEVKIIDSKNYEAQV